MKLAIAWQSMMFQPEVTAQNIDGFHENDVSPQNGAKGTVITHILPLLDEILQAPSNTMLSVRVN